MVKESKREPSGRRGRRRSWGNVIGLSALPLVTAAGSAFAFTTAGTVMKADSIHAALLFWGYALAVVTLALGVAKVLLDHRARNQEAFAIQDADDARGTLTFAMKDVLQQLAEVIAEMPYLRSAAEMDAHLRLVSKHGVDALRALVTPNEGEVRANVFALTSAQNGLIRSRRESRCRAQAAASR